MCGLIPKGNNVVFIGDHMNLGSRCGGRSGEADVNVCNGAIEEGVGYDVVGHIRQILNNVCHGDMFDRKRAHVREGT